jgi:hypothetical protein
MKTSLDELQWREDCLLGRAPGEQQTVFQAKLIVDPTLDGDVRWQRKAYALVRAYGRKHLRKELEKIHRELLAAPEHRIFRDRILALFRK